jgi:hypothetical protein
MKTRTQQRSGQALIEMMVGLVGLLVVFTGLLTIAHMGYAQSNVMMQARRAAGEYAMAQAYVTEAPSPYFILDWTSGQDQKKFSSDDKMQTGDPTEAVRKIVDPAKPDELEARISDNAISSLGSSSLLDGFHLVHARVSTNHISLLPAAQHLFYKSDNVHIDGDVTLTWTRGIN